MDTTPQMAVKRSDASKQAYKSVDYSGLFERFFAWLIDIIIIAGLGYLLYKIFGLLAAVMCSFVLDLLIRISLTYLWGGTFGKLLLGVRVISRCSEKLLLGQVVVRELFKYISWLFINLGFVMIIFNRRKRAWHDMAACTVVTSGGRDEAEYAKEVYSERPEKWHAAALAPITGVLVAAVIIAINAGSIYALYNKGMLGFPVIAAFPSNEFVYKIPEGMQGLEKAVIQVGDADGNGKYEIYRESIEDGNILIRNVRLSGFVPVDGERTVMLDKPVMQYRVLDMDGDKKDEMAVLLQDKSVKIFKLDGEIAEIMAFGPLGYSEISSFIKGKPDENVPWRLYTLGDGNKLTILYMENGEFKNREFTLEASDKLTSIDMGIFDDENYIVGVSESSRLMFYKYDGSAYKLIKYMDVPIKGKVSMSIKDMNYDDKNEVILWSRPNDERPYPVMAAYSISGSNMRLVWDGGRYYDYDGIDYSLSLNDAIDIDKDGNLELYAVENRVVGQNGRYSIFVFQNDNIMLKLNDFMRLLSFSDVK